jgi:hypothetical protein
MSDPICGHLTAIESVKAPTQRVCEACVKTGDQWVHLTHLPGMRRHPLLRQLAKSAREQARVRQQASGDRLGRDR